jgi:hypothetical protein
MIKIFIILLNCFIFKILLSSTYDAYVRKFKEFKPLELIEPLPISPEALKAYTRLISVAEFESYEEFLRNQSKIVTKYFLEEDIVIPEYIVPIAYCIEQYINPSIQIYNERLKSLPSLIEANDLNTINYTKNIDSLFLQFLLFNKLRALADLLRDSHFKLLYSFALDFVVSAVLSDSSHPIIKTDFKKFFPLEAFLNQEKLTPDCIYPIKFSQDHTVAPFYWIISLAIPFQHKDFIRSVGAQFIDISYATFKDDLYQNLLNHLIDDRLHLKCYVDFIIPKRLTKILKEETFDKETALKTYILETNLQQGVMWDSLKEFFDSLNQNRIDSASLNFYTFADEFFTSQHEFTKEVMHIKGTRTLWNHFSPTDSLDIRIFFYRFMNFGLYKKLFESGLDQEFLKFERILKSNMQRLNQETIQQ